MSNRRAVYREPRNKIVMASNTELILREFLSGLFPNEEPTLHEINSTGANYTSALYAIEIGKRALFAKIVNVSEQLRKIMNVGHMYTTEIYVYTKLAPVYSTLKLQFEFPKYYGGDNTFGKETVVMEDLRARGFASPDRLVSVTWEQAKSAVNTLATFHALSFVIRHTNPEFYEDASKVLVTPIKSETLDETTKSAMERMVRSALEAISDPVHKKKMMMLLSNKQFRPEYFKFLQPISVPVFCHGDYRTSNMLTKETENGTQTIVIDYQTVHTGCPASDILYYEFLGTDQEFRRKYHEKLLKHYHSQLAQALAEHDILVEDVYSWDTFQDEIKEMLPRALIVAVVLLPIVTVDESQAPKTSSGDVSEFAREPSTLFHERFDTLVQDCVQWGVL